MTRKVLLYGDVNLNYRDGSGAWLQALAECLTMTGSDVHVLLKADVTDSSRLDRISSNRKIVLHTPFDNQVSGLAGMKPREAASRIAVLDRRHRYDIIISRGFDIASHLAISRKFTRRLWPYLTEGPVFSFTPSDRQLELIDAIATESRRIFLQTEDARSIVESLNGAMTGKTLVMNPIIPDEAFRETESHEGTGTPMRMIYAGKFARLWNTLEMTELPDILAAKGVETRLIMIGDKFQNTGDDDQWLEAMKTAAAIENPLVEWRGGLPREDVLNEVFNADVGLCWRDAELDSSPEISTKMLECAALGTPPILNRTAMHEELLGEDYPLFVDGNDVISTILTAAQAPNLVEEARLRGQQAAKRYSMSATAERIDGYLRRAEADPSTTGQLFIRERKHRVVVAGHDFKFASELIEMLEQRPDVELRIDKWHRLASHDEKASLDSALWADTVICEWAGPNAVFYSTHIKETTKLIVRFHGFEIRGEWLKQLDPRRVDAFVFVSDFYRQHVLRTLGWPEERSTVIHNTIDVGDLDRPKAPDSQFRIGMAGYVPFLKRPDRAVDLLNELLDFDDRFELHIRGRLPWQYPWEWQKPAGQDAYRNFFRKVSRDARVRDRVVFALFSPDMANWFRNIGWMVSSSIRETFHLAPIEGMASGAPALVWEREGATGIFGETFVRKTTSDLAKLVIDTVTDGNWQELSAQSKVQAAQYDLMKARQRWVELLALPRGGRPVLHGTSVLDEGADPQDRAEALVALRRSFEDNGAFAASKVFESYPHWLDDELDQVTSWSRLAGWADGSSLPPVGLSPLYNAKRDHALAVGTRRTKSYKNLTTTPIPTPRSLGSFDKDVLVAADAFTRAAVRERVSGIIAEGSLGTALAAEVTARRLGIPLYLGEVGEVPGSGRIGTYFQEIRSRVLDQARNINELDEFPNMAIKSIDVPLEVRQLSNVKIGLIADEFTRRTISEAVPTRTLKRSGGQEQLDGLDAVIVESAWEGEDREWFHGVAYHGEVEATALWDLIAGSRKRGIPVLFWNKEDPVHFRSFAPPASRIDHVFTTDASRIPNYLEQPNKNLTVSSLPFFAEPKLHNPLPSSRSFSRTASFAGTYYGARYQKRSDELRSILEVVAEFGLTIYDRQKDIPNSPYQLPPELQVHSVGAVPYDQVLQVYKSHLININVNSVSDSPSMFSRRVVEIAASGSVVASGIGRGVSESLGPDFPVLTSPEEWKSHLRAWFTDEDLRLRTAWAQLRTVLRSHRADQAIALMLRTAGVPVNPTRMPTYGWKVQDHDQLRAARAQSLPPVVITQDETLCSDALQVGLEVSSEPSSVDWITEAPPTVREDHFEDMLFACLFTEADVLSTRLDPRADAPLLNQGIGNLETALWRTNLPGPENGANPWVWRTPKGTF